MSRGARGGGSGSPAERRAIAVRLQPSGDPGHSKTPRERNARATSTPPKIQRERQTAHRGLPMPTVDHPDSFLMTGGGQALQIPNLKAAVSSLCNTSYSERLARQHSRAMTNRSDRTPRPRRIALTLSIREMAAGNKCNDWTARFRGWEKLQLPFIRCSRANRRCNCPVATTRFMARSCPDRQRPAARMSGKASCLKDRRPRSIAPARHMRAFPSFNSRVAGACEDREVTRTHLGKRRGTRCCLHLLFMPERAGCAFHHER